jgi:hypothetical protein
MAGYPRQRRPDGAGTRRDREARDLISGDDPGHVPSAATARPANVAATAPASARARSGPEALPQNQSTPRRGIVRPG